MKLSLKQVGIIIALVLGVLILFLPAQGSSSYRFDPEALSKQIASNNDQIDPDSLSEWIIEGRRDFMLVDIRSADEFGKGAIKGADNIPMETLLKRDTIDTLPKEKFIVLYSNGSSHASQAWLVLKSAGFDSYILEGGFNYWNKYIMNPDTPSVDAPDDEILRYRTRLAVKNHFGGATEITSADNQPPVKKKTIVKRPPRKKKKLKGC